jgi:polyisoprenoid-binding protein YceI
VNRNILTTLVVIVLLAVVGVGVWWFLGGNSELTQTAQDGAEELEAQTAVETVFRIDPVQSEASFSIDEVLRGEDVTVVGVTSQVAGDIRVDVSNPTASTIGEIRINARDLTTDESNRNRALQRFILRSGEDEYEFITFEPTAVNNMPESVTVGEAFEFEIVGNLTIIDTTNEVTFNATVTPTSETVIEGTAQTTVNYNDWGLSIPSVPFVASVEDDVILNISFVATEVTEETAS